MYANRLRCRKITHSLFRAFTQRCERIEPYRIGRAQIGREVYLPIIAQIDRCRNIPHGFCLYFTVCQVKRGGCRFPEKQSYPVVSHPGGNCRGFFIRRCGNGHIQYVWRNLFIRNEYYKSDSYGCRVIVTTVPAVSLRQTAAGIVVPSCAFQYSGDLSSETRNFPLK